MRTPVAHKAAERKRAPAPLTGAPQATPLLSVIVPAYNEEPTIQAILHKVLALDDVAIEVIVVDDGSTDATGHVARAVCMSDRRVKLLTHARNRGKGAAVRTAIPEVRGDIVVIQDADLEYDPRDLARMVRLFEDPAVSVVYGSRQRKCAWSSRLLYDLGSAILTKLTNLLYGSRITDEPTGYKMIRTEVLRAVSIEEDGFELCPELTAKLLLAGYAISEVPISYRPRTRAQGKKLTWRHGWRGLRTLLKCRIQHRLLVNTGRQYRRP